MAMDAISRIATLFRTLQCPPCNPVMPILVSSSLIALFAVPMLVLASGLMAHFHVGQTHTLDLVFSPMEVVAVILSVAIVVVLNMDGQSNWFEGALLLALYMILGVAFFYIPEGRVATVK